MKNLIKYAEKYSEWVALGLGTLFVLYVVYGYVVAPPITATVSTGRVVKPGDVDQITLSESGEKLQTAMNRSDVPPMPVEPFAERFTQVIKGQGQTEVALKNPQLFHGPTAGYKGSDIVDRPPTPEGDLVKSLPVPPTPVPTGIVSGLSNVAVPEAGAAPNAVVPAGNSQDREWVTAVFKISSKELADSFAIAKTKIPPAINRTSFLQVELIREEKLPGGGWGNRTVIEPLVNQQVPPFPGNDRQAQVIFRDWAEKNAATIIEPVFYQVLGGDKWHLPGETVEAPTVSVVKPDEGPKPPTIKPKPAPKPKPEIRPKEAPPSPKQRPPAPGGGHRPNYAPRDADRPNPNRPDRGPAPPGLPPGMIPPPGGMPNQRGVAQPAQPNQAKASGSAISGVFDPSTLTEDVVIWAHDDTVESGKTYHYMIRYKLRNPVFQTGNIATKQLADQFAIESKVSEPTDPVTIKPRTIFYVISGPSPTGKSVRVEVFKWSKGKQTSKIFEVSPGDLIGADADSEFITGWSVVDFRKDYGMDDDVVVIVDENNNLVKRSYKRDQKDPQYQGLKDAVGNAKQEPGQAAGR